MLNVLIKKLNKIKKKHGDIPVMYVYSDASELSLANLSEIYLVYTNLDVFGASLVYSASIKEGNFISEKNYDPEKHIEFKPVVLITEKL